MKIVTTHSLQMEVEKGINVFLFPFCIHTCDGNRISAQGCGGGGGGRLEDNLVTLTKAEALAYGGREDFQTLGGGSNGEGGSLRRSWAASLLGRLGFV